MIDKEAIYSKSMIDPQKHRMHRMSLDAHNIFSILKKETLFGI